MEHLTGEELARLVDEQPDSAEQVHLDVCVRCADELEAMIAQRWQLSMLCDPAVPERILTRVKRQLADEGVVRAPASPGTMRWGRAIAAGFALFVTGAASGAFLGQRLPLGMGEPMSARTAEEASDPGSSAPRTLEAAAAEMQRTEAAYLRAVSDYSELSQSDDGLDPLNRLAALEGIMLTTEAALREAPADPIINNYHLTALGQRDALMRELQLVEDEQEWF